MALDLTVPGLTEELRASGEKQGRYLDSLDGDIERYVGPSWRRGFGKNEPAPAIYEWITRMLPQMSFGNPVVRVQTSRVGRMAHDRAKGLQFATNHWARETDMRFLNEELGIDFALRWAVCHITSEPRPGMIEREDPIYWPSARRISPRRFRFDIAVPSIKQARWQGHLIIRDKEDIVREANEDDDSGWDLEALQKMQGGPQGEWRDKQDNVPDRNEIAYWEIHVPEHELEESPGREKGYLGTVFTVGDGQGEGSWIRAPRPHFGVAPYEFGGALLVPDDPFPLAPVVATSAQAEYLNRIKRAVINAVENYKRLLLVRKGKVDLAKTIREGENDWVYQVDVEELARNVVNFEVGGLTQQHLVAQEDAEQTHDRAAGTSDAMQGNVTGDATARENLIAYDVANTRTGWITLKYRDLIRRILRKVSETFDRDDDIVYDLGPEAMGEFFGPDGKPIEQPRFQGGMQKGQSPDDFILMDYEIEASSMERVSEAARQYQMAVIDETVDRVAMLGVQTAPWMNWDRYIEAKANLANVPELVEIIDTEALEEIGVMQQIAQMEAGAMQTAASAPEAKPRPRFGSDILGALPAYGGGGAKPAVGAVNPLEAQQGSPSGGAKPGGPQKSTARAGAKGKKAQSSSKPKAKAKAKA